MATKTGLGKVIGIRLPEALLRQYEAESESSGIAVSTLVRRDVLRIRAVESAPNSSNNAHLMGTHDVKKPRKGRAA